MGATTVDLVGEWGVGHHNDSHFESAYMYVTLSRLSRDQRVMIMVDARVLFACRGSSLC